VSAISAQMVKELREKTGAGVLDCRKALDSAGGDMEKAEQLLIASGAGKAAKKAERTANEGRIEGYVHPGNRVAVLVEVNCESDFVARTEAFLTFAHDVALQIAFTSPQFVGMEQIPADVLAERTAAFRSEALADGKPEKIVDKIVEGKLKKWAQEACLLDQPFVKNEDVTIAELLKQTIAQTGENIVVRRFSRFELGGN
jgi:elongation factor Ts